MNDGVAETKPKAERSNGYSVPKSQQSDGEAEWKENRHEVTSERSKANRSKTAARSRAIKTGLMNFALRNLGVGSVKKGVLFERSEFHPL